MAMSYYLLFSTAKSRPCETLARQRSDSLAPGMSSPQLTSVDGQIVDTAKARIPASDDGLLRGDGVFEVIRLYAGRPKRLRGELSRSRDSRVAQIRHVRYPRQARQQLAQQIDPLDSDDG